MQGESLDYSAFCSIFEQDKERGEGRLASAASQRSLKSSDSMRSLVLDEKDFQKFIAQYDGDDWLINDIYSVATSYKYHSYLSLVTK